MSRLSPISCGIDFGTSNSTVALSDADGVRLIDVEGDKTTLPSGIFFKKNVGPLFGRRAIDAYLHGDEGRLLRGLKKILGTPLMNEKTNIGGRSVSFTEILGVFVGHLKDKAEAAARQNIESVVMGRPVHFHDDNALADQSSQDTLERVARAAGFSRIEFLYEPIAAAFAHEANVPDENLSLVVDLGGGTSDFTVIKISSRYLKKIDRSDDILSTSGVRVGGTTFDYRLSLQDFMPALGLGSHYTDLFDKSKTHVMPSGVYFDLSDWALVHQAQTQKAILDTKDIRRRTLEPEKMDSLLTLQENHLGHALLQEVERAKIELSTQDDFIARLSDLENITGFPVTRNGFEQSIARDVAKILSSIHECLNRAQVGAGDIDLVILTGGSTELPVIDRLVRGLFPQAAISQGNKLDSVGLGLAYRAAALFR